MVSFIEKSIRRTRVTVAALTVVTFVVGALEEEPTSQSNTHPKGAVSQARSDHYDFARTSA